MPSSPKMTTEWRSVRLFPIPSIIYLVHNNVQFATLTYVDTSTYQIMGNLKIVTTGILFRFLYILTTDIILIDFYSQSLLLIYQSFTFCKFFRLFLRRRLSTLQWMAIVLLAVGTTTSQVILGNCFMWLFFSIICLWIKIIHEFQRDCTKQFQEFLQSSTS